MCVYIYIYIHTYMSSVERARKGDVTIFLLFLTSWKTSLCDWNFCIGQTDCSFLSQKFLLDLPLG
jgi:hypothetical protein